MKNQKIDTLFLFFSFFTRHFLKNKSVSVYIPAIESDLRKFTFSSYYSI